MFLGTWTKHKNMCSCPEVPFCFEWFPLGNTELPIPTNVLLVKLVALAFPDAMQKNC